MNIRDLIDELEALADQHGDYVEVRLAHQPEWPFEYALDQVVAVNTAEDDEGFGDKAEEDEGDALIVYLAEGSQIGYLPGVATNALGWGRR